METLLEHAGGESAIRRFAGIFYDRVLSDPLLQPLFGNGQPDHVDHLTAFEVETFGGPDRYTSEFGGFDRIIAVHRHLKITEEPKAALKIFAPIQRSCPIRPDGHSQFLTPVR
jgi:hemoglobin